MSSNIKVNEHIKKIEDLKRQYELTKSPYRKKDLRKAINRMRKELIECKQFIKNAEKARSTLKS